MISAVIPTLGRSPHLADGLDALRRQSDDLEIVLVAQGFEPAPEIVDRVDRVLRLPANAGFARANNLAFAEARGELLATVNDDVLVEDGWLRALAGALESAPRAAAVQGWNLDFRDPSRVDGGGLAWNSSWQAVQILHGEPLPERLEKSPVEIFGVSATAALYRRKALEAVGAPGLSPFDEELFAYYEDVDLAIRLRAAGTTALRVPDARCRHVGSLTGRRMGWARWRLLYGNRQLVLARLLGRDFRRRWPRILTRDLVDLGRALAAGDGSRALGIAGGLARFARRAPRYLHRGAPVSLGAFQYHRDS